jgi:hypothetical protein
MRSVERLAKILADGEEKLVAIAEEEAARRPLPGKWSKKEELGHLVDSAWNNYARVVRVQLEDSPALPGYRQEAWVERQGYQERDWRALIALWSASNEHLLAAARRIPEAALGRKCTIGDSAPMTLGFVIDDYVDHLVHHLAHIGVDVRSYRRPESAYS